MTIKPTQNVERTLILGKIEATKGIDPLPTKIADAFLVGNADLQLDPTVLERDLYRPSFSPIPGSVGRKVVNVSFNHEVKGSGANGTRPRLGTLLRACGMQETLVIAGAATQIADPQVWGNIVGADVAWAKDVAPTSKFGAYLIECVVGGASATAEFQVTRFNQSEYDATVGLNTRIDAVANYSALTTITLDDSDLTSLDFTIAGTVTEGDDIYAVVQGEVFRYTITAANEASGTAEDDVATALAALIDADARFDASATGAVVTVTFAGNAAPVVVTSGTTAITLGDSAAELTPTWTGNVTKGQQWLVVLYEEGYHYEPVTAQEDTDSMTIYFYKDGNLHIVTGCQGSITFTGEAGNYGQAQFEFTGNFADPVPERIPTGVVYEQTTPPQIELAEMSLRGDKDFCAQSFTFAYANTINARDCMNGAEGINGSAINSRQPTAQFNPESGIEVYTNMWGSFAAGETMPVHLRVGSVLNNIVRFYSERASFTGLNYGDRNGTVTIEPAFQLNGVSADGDDELRIVFPQG